MKMSSTILNGILATLLLALPGLSHAAPTSPVFDHLTTGYELTGQHRLEPCESCHVDAVFRGTPRNCDSCHTPGSRIGATTKPATHVMSSSNCEKCHTSTAWSPTRRFDHGEVQGSCASCHNGVQAVGKPPGHVPTTQDCATCHGTPSWTPAGFDHSSVVAGTCAQCHDGVRAIGKTPTHIATTASCDACHSTIAWLPARFDHANVAPGTCSQCHNGTSATGKPGNHWLTNLECDACHRTTAWTPVTHIHTSPDYPGNHRGPPPCTACHANRDAATWTYPQYRPFCAGCHANDYRPAVDSHRGLDRDLNCGSCHRVTAASWSN